MNARLLIELDDAVLNELIMRVVEQTNVTPRLDAPWLDVDSAAEYLATSTNSVRGMVKRRQIPFHKPNGRLLFNRRELDEWVLQS